MTYIDENRIRRDKTSIVLEEEGGGDLGNGADDFLSSFFFYLATIFVLLESCITLTYHAFDSAKLAGFLRNTHCEVVGVAIFGA